MKDRSLQWLLGVWLLGHALAVAGPAPEAPSHWAFQPIRDPAIPNVTDDAWCRTSIDRFILARLEQAGIAPAPATDPRTLLRRVAFGLTGLPPSAAESDALASDPSPGAFGQAVERLLASPGYGERWGRHWLDVVRYADTAGETADYPVPVAWRYRNYVIDAFNADKPYDVFLREQIAGDILAQDGPRERYAEQVAATGFLALSRRFGFDSENYHHLTLQDTIDTLGQGVLGLTLGCARCHTHKYDPVPIADYYALYGIFESTRYAFPGSEQKQRHRALVPLVPPGESQLRWREFENRVAALSRKAQGRGKPVPAAVLRSLDDLDGDFEMQAPAAGGSKGVLVPPWLHEGSIAITTDAQSPFRNLHPMGRVGADIPAGAAAYHIRQALPSHRSRAVSGQVHVNLDFRVTTDSSPAPGRHRFWLGNRTGTAAVEVFLSDKSLAIRTGDSTVTLRPLESGEWVNLQLTLDLLARTVSGRAGVPGDLTDLPARQMASDWDGALEAVGFDAPDGVDTRPALALDNLGIETGPIPPASTKPTRPASDPADPDPAAIEAELRQLAGIDGGFELQNDQTAPAAPWGPGPNSVVRIQADAQSPFHNLHPPGRLGVHLPNSGAYNGFGQTLPQPWKSEATPLLYASFDFRCVSVAAGDGGTWRYYLGHGPGQSAAVELYFDGSSFHQRSGDRRDRVADLSVGEWYQVQLTLDLMKRKYSGTLASRSGRTPFDGDLAAGWDGSIDYTFIDSYGHREGVKPALDADNFTLGTLPLAPLEATPMPLASDGENRRLRVAELRGRQAEWAAEADAAAQELERLLAEGPMELAYAVSEGTPRNARIQLRGEPDRPGDEVPRGFLTALGGESLPPGVTGSGRLELAQWLTSPSNPLTARVMVNRIWQHHFGQGLVKTPNDFGLRGQPPTHPELLDHLATQFIRSGWSVKAIHRLILDSAVYRQRSRTSTEPTDLQPAPATADCPVLPSTAGLPRGSVATASDDLFSPFTRRRLGAEEMRDSILLASGALELSPGEGHPFPSPTGWSYTQHGPYSAVYEHRRRSVYLMAQRLKRHPFLALFDGADPNASTPQRHTTTVPTQALFFLNDPLVHEQAALFTSRVLGSAPDEPGRIRTAYRLALGRSPTPVETTETANFLAAYRSGLATASHPDPIGGAWAALARVLFGSNEFLTVD